MNSMNRLVIACAAAVAVSAMADARPANAQTKEARGTVTSVSENAITIKAGTGDMTFVVNSATRLEVRRAARDVQKNQPGTPSPRVNDFFEPGTPVLIRFREDKGQNYALDISRVGSAGEGGVTEPEKIAEGKVKSVTGSQLIIEGQGRDMTFAVTKDTGVLVKGATKATKAAGGTTTMATFVHPGDTVSVSYKESGQTMTASEVRVRISAK